MQKRLFIIINYSTFSPKNWFPPTKMENTFKWMYAHVKKNKDNQYQYILQAFKL